MNDAALNPVSVRIHALDPVRAELRLTPSPGVELRGRLMGPRCPFASTVEVAYPVRPVPGSPGTFQIIIPEPSLWEPPCPYLYEGPLEQWRDGVNLGQTWLRQGLRTLALGKSGLRVNGKPCSLRGVAIDSADEDDLLRLRQRGCNLLLAPAGNAALWDLAGRLGFLMLGREPATEPAAPARASALGWVMTEIDAHTADWRSSMNPGEYFGLLLDAMPTRPLPREVSFLVVAEPLIAELRPLALPMIARQKDGEGEQLVSTW